MTNDRPRMSIKPWWSGAELPSALLTDASVNSLAQQVSMTVVPGVLLDHVDQQLTQGDRVPLPILSDEAEVGVSYEPLGEVNLLMPGRPCFIHDLLIGHCSVEVTVGLGIGLVTPGYGEAGEPPTEPPTLDLGHVSDQAKQRHR